MDFKNENNPRKNLDNFIEKFKFYERINDYGSSVNVNDFLLMPITISERLIKEQYKTKKKEYDEMKKAKDSGKNKPKSYIR